MLILFQSRRVTRNVDYSEPQSDREPDYTNQSIIPDSQSNASYRLNPINSKSAVSLFF